MDDITEGPVLDNGAVLFKGDEGDEVFLTDAGAKRHILSPEVMIKYQFDKGPLNNIPQSVVDKVPRGADWT